MPKTALVFLLGLIVLVSQTFATPSSWASKDSKVRLIFVGDMMLERLPGKYIAAGQDPYAAFSKVFADADIRVGNLECVTSDLGAKVEKHYTFRADPKVLKQVSKHFDAVSLANNHTGDFSHEGLVDMFAQLKAHNLGYFGAGKDLADAHTPWIIEKNGIKVALLGYNEFRPVSFAAGPTTPGVAWSNDAEVLADIKAVRPKVDLVLTFMHWGAEYITHPNERQKTLAHMMIDAGADVVVGGHPHVTEGAEMYNGKLIVYSLGNFVFDDFNDLQKEGRPELDELARTSWILRLTMNKKGLLEWDTVVSRTGEDGFPKPVPGAHGPSSASMTKPELIATTKEQPLPPRENPPLPCQESVGMRRCVNGKLQPTHVEMVKLSVGSPNPEGLILSQLSAYSLNKEFVEADFAKPNPQKQESFTAGPCTLSKFDYNLYYDYPDPNGFDLKIKDILLSNSKGQSLDYKLATSFRDSAPPSFDHKTFVSWVSSGETVKVQSNSEPADGNFSTEIQSQGKFKVKTDKALFRGKDFHGQITGKFPSEMLRVSLGGFNSNNYLGYNILCQFPRPKELTASTWSFVIPAELTGKIPSQDVPQKVIDIGVEPIHAQNVDTLKSPEHMIRVVTSTRTAVSVPIR